MFAIIKYYACCSVDRVGQNGGGGWKINVVFDYTELCVVHVFIILSIMFDHMMLRYLIIKIDTQAVHNYLYINTDIWMTLCAYDFRDLREFCLMLYCFCLLLLVSLYFLLLKFENILITCTFN